MTRCPEAGHSWPRLAMSRWWKSRWWIARPRDRTGPGGRRLTMRATAWLRPARAAVRPGQVQSMWACEQWGCPMSFPIEPGPAREASLVWRHSRREAWARTGRRPASSGAWPGAIKCQSSGLIASCAMASCVRVGRMLSKGKARGAGLVGVPAKRSARKFPRWSCAQPDRGVRERSGWPLIH